MCTLVNLKVLNRNLTGFSFSKNLLSILTSFELINLYPSPPLEISKKPYNFKGNRVFSQNYFCKTMLLTLFDDFLDLARIKY